MKNFLIRWAISAFSIFIVAHIVRGIEVPNIPTVMVVALVLGIVNAFVRPLVILITLPINMLTLGVSTLFINGALFLLVSKIVKGFVITGFWPAFWGYILFSIISFLLSLLVISDK